jgi:hypothetical protein
MKNTDPEFWAELTAEQTQDLPSKNIQMPED